MPQKTFISRAEADNLSIAREILDICNPSRIFALYGELGAGKTTLIKALGAVLGVTETISSPTFSLVHSYDTPSGVAVHHFDFYRLKQESEAYDIGTEEYIDSGAYVFMEWPERIPTLLPSESIELRLSILPDQARHIQLTYR